MFSFESAQLKQLSSRLQQSFARWPGSSILAEDSVRNQVNAFAANYRKHALCALSSGTVPRTLTALAAAFRSAPVRGVISKSMKAFDLAFMRVIAAFIVAAE